MSLQGARSSCCKQNEENEIVPGRRSILVGMRMLTLKNELKLQASEVHKRSNEIESESEKLHGTTTLQSVGRLARLRYALITLRHKVITMCCSIPSVLICTGKDGNFFFKYFRHYF